VRAHHPDVVVAAFGAVNEHWGALDFADEDKVRQNQERKRVLYHARRFVLEHLRIAQWIHELQHPNFMRELREAVILRRDQMEAMAEESASADFKGVRRVPLERFKELLSTLVNEARADGARVILMVNPRRAVAEEQFPVLPLYSQAVLEVATALGVQVLDERSRWKTLEEQGTSEDELFIGDFWHPNPKGHARIAGDLAELVLDANLNVGRDPSTR
jgi:hypothetical protein